MKGLFKIFMLASIAFAFSVTMIGNPLMAGQGNGKVPPGQAKNQPAPVVAVNPPGQDKGGPIGTPGSDKTIKHHVEVLEQEVAALQVTVASLQVKFSNLSAIVASINANPVLGLGDFVSVKDGTIKGLKGPHIFFTGANVHIVSGSKETDDFGALLGLGNLVIGYNEAPFPMGALDRAGSHNLIVGPLHTYPSFGGIVGGTENTISGKSASVTGGSHNTAGGDNSSVSGGTFRNVTGLNNWAAGGLFQAN